MTTPKINPLMVTAGDVVAPPWNPRILLTCSGVVQETTLDVAIPNHPAHLDGSMPMVVVYGEPGASPPRLNLRPSDRLWLVKPGRKSRRELAS